MKSTGRTSSALISLALAAVPLPIFAAVMDVPIERNSLPSVVTGMSGPIMPLSSTALNQLPGSAIRHIPAAGEPLPLAVFAVSARQASLDPAVAAHLVPTLSPVPGPAPDLKSLKPEAKWVTREGSSSLEMKWEMRPNAGSPETLRRLMQSAKSMGPEGFDGRSEHATAPVSPEPAGEVASAARAPKLAPIPGSGPNREIKPSPNWPLGPFRETKGEDSTPKWVRSIQGIPWVGRVHRILIGLHLATPAPGWPWPKGEHPVFTYPSELKNMRPGPNWAKIDVDPARKPIPGRGPDGELKPSPDWPPLKPQY